MLRLFAGALIASACLAEVSLLQGPDRVAVVVDGRTFGSLHFGVDANKPFFHPLTTPKGIRDTRSFPLEKVDGEPTDHPSWQEFAGRTN